MLAPVTAESTVVSKLTSTPSTVNRSSKKESAVAPAPARKKVRPASEHSLAHLIPEEWYAEDYISRTFDGHEDIELLDYARKVRQNVLMYGPTGPGKTSCVYAYAAKNKIPVVYIACNGAIDPATLFSRVLMREDGTFGYMEMDIITACREGGIILADECNFIPPRIAAVLHGALDKRRTIVVPELNLALKLHPNTQIVGTFNPDYEGTKPLNPAFRNRFAIKLEFDYDRGIEKQLVLSIPALLDLADKLRVAKNQGDIETPCSTNMLLEFEQIAWDLGVEFAVTNFIASFHEHERAAVKKSVEHLVELIKKQLAASIAAEKEEK